MPARLAKLAPRTWRKLPHKEQLTILTSVRFVDFYQLASVQTCAYWLLHSLDPRMPPQVLSMRVGMLQGLFTAGQTVSGAPWGRAADVFGRKPVLLAGLMGMVLSGVVMAFSTSFTVLASCRLLAGLANGTTAACKASVADMVPQEQHGRAFTMLFLAFNVANVVSPVISAALFDPVSWYTVPGWMRWYPFAAPSLLSAFLLGVDAVVVWLYLRESLPRHFRVGIYHLVPRGSEENSDNGGDEEGTEIVGGEEEEVEAQEGGETSPEDVVTRKVMLAVRRLWTRRFVGSLVLFALLEYHLGLLTALWPLFLASPSRKPDDPVKLPLHFSGGLQLTPTEVGAATAMLGGVGLTLQLAIMASIAPHDAVKAFGATQPLLVLTYALAPYLALMVDPASGSSSMALLWPCILVGTALHAVARTYALLATTILLDGAVPPPCRRYRGQKTTLRATAHGVAAVVSGLCRTHGAVVGGVLHGWGQANGVAGLAWWVCALLSAVGWGLSVWI